MAKSNVKIPSINKAQISGRICNDLEVKHTTSGTAVLRLTVACDRNYKKGDEWVKETVFIPCIAWQNLAENTAKNAKKGMPVIVEGRLNVETYTTKEGIEKSQTNIVADKIHVLEWLPKEETFDSPSQGEDTPF